MFEFVNIFFLCATLSIHYKNLQAPSNMQQRNTACVFVVILDYDFPPKDYKLELNARYLNYCLTEFMKNSL